MKSIIFALTVVAICLSYASAQSASSVLPTTFTVSAQPFDRAAAVESIYRTLAALDNLKRVGACANATLSTQRLADLNTTLSTNFQYYNLSTNGGPNEGPYVLQANRAAYLLFMSEVAQYSAYHGSQHSAVDPIVSFSADGRTAYITGRFIEYGDFLITPFQGASPAIPTPEESQSDFSVVAQLENLPSSTVWPNFGPIIDKTQRTITAVSAFRPVIMYEQGNMKKTNGITRDYMRNQCPGVPDATSAI